MAYPRRLLGEGEEIVLELHPHWKALVLPTIALPVVVFLGFFLYFRIPESRFDTFFRWVVVLAALAALTVWVVVPFLRWRTTTYVLTSRRLIMRSGILSRQGRDMPLTRVNDASFSHNVVDRILRCGTLIIESAGERGQLVLASVPNVESVQREVYRQVELQAGPTVDASDDDQA